MLLSPMLVHSMRKEHKKSLSNLKHVLRQSKNDIHIPSLFIAKSILAHGWTFVGMFATQPTLLVIPSQFRSRILFRSESK
jgi:hypothetical protein